MKKAMRRGLIRSLNLAAATAATALQFEQRWLETPFERESWRLRIVAALALGMGLRDNEALRRLRVMLAGIETDLSVKDIELLSPEWLTGGYGE